MSEESGTEALRKVRNDKAVRDVRAILSGDRDRYLELIKEHLGTRDPDEADRRTQMIWAWREGEF